MRNIDRSDNCLWSRRKILALIRATGAGWLVGGVSKQARAAQLSNPSPFTRNTPFTNTAIGTFETTPESLPACVVRPEQIEGPYFVDEALNRSDIRSDPSDGSIQAGIPLQLTFQVSQISEAGCVPLAEAIVDIWQCNAFGVYSDVTDPGFSTLGQKFLRGYQVTDSNGRVKFSTIYPGWYPGRTVHIHFKVRTHFRTNSASVQLYEFTSQLYFDDAITDRVYTQEPYASQGERTVRNAQDWIFRSGGTQLLLLLTQSDSGYAATFDIGLQIEGQGGEIEQEG